MEAKEKERSEYCQCYLCGAGCCIHVICGPVMIRLTPAQFEELSQAVQELRAALDKEQPTPVFVC